MTKEITQSYTAPTGDEAYKGLLQQLPCPPHHRDYASFTVSTEPVLDGEYKGQYRSVCQYSLKRAAGEKVTKKGTGSIMTSLEGKIRSSVF
jgi:hypothetical protein